MNINAGNSETLETTVKTEDNNATEIEIPFSLFQYLSSEGCNVQNICRICLSVNEQLLYPMFSTKERILANMFIAVTDLKIHTDDSMPSFLCSKCQTEVMKFYQFKTKCIKSDYTLKCVLKGDFVTKDEPSTNLFDISHESTQELPIKFYGRDEETNVKPEKNILKDEQYLQNLKEAVSDDEALCIVQDTGNNQKQVTIYDKISGDIEADIDSNNLLDKVVKQKTSKKRRHYCSLCSKQFRKIKSLRAHIKKHHAAFESPYPCQECRESFESESDLKLHGMIHSSGDTWKCTECQKVFNAKYALRRHILRHMKMKRYPCQVCGKTFVEHYALRRHSRVHTGEILVKKYACRFCDKRFVNSSVLRSHEAGHGGNSHECEQCHKRFASPRLLASHRRVHSDQMAYVCRYCPRKFRHESTRNTHHRTHTGERPYVCAACGKAFIQKSNLTLHMRTHTGERPYKCSQCGRTFSSGSTLKAHERTHTGERPYACEICGQRFARLSLSTHMRLHSGERPFACSACPKTYTTRSQLKEHQRKHTGEKPYECVKCNQKFISKSHLLKHYNRHEKKTKNKRSNVRHLPMTNTEAKLSEYIILQPNSSNINHNMQEIVVEEPIQTELMLQDNDIKTQVIVLGDNQNLTNNVSFVNDGNDVNLVTVNEEVSISAESTNEGTTVKLYQIDQSLLQIHTGGGQLTVSRVSSKMTANF